MSNRKKSDKMRKDRNLSQHEKAKRATLKRVKEHEVEEYEADDFELEEHDAEEYEGEDMDSEAEEIDEDLRFVSLDEEEETNDKKEIDWKKVGIITGSIIGVLALVYIGISVFFMNHFYINTEINGNNFSAKTVQEVEDFMKNEVKDYVLTVKERNNKADKITGKDISLEYKTDDEIRKALEEQNAFLWPMAFFVDSSTQVKVNVNFNKKALDEKISQLQSVTAEQIPAVNAHPKFDGNEFVVEPETPGTAVNMEVLQKKVHEAIAGFQRELDMDKEGCYQVPKYDSKSPEVEEACKAMNEYLKASITYTMDENVVVDKQLISTWVTVDDNMQVTFNETAVKEWLTAFGDKYDTLGTTRSITTPWGKTVEVSGGDYGWSINEDAEFEALVKSIKEGEVVTKEPAYYNAGRGAVHGPQDWGTTYAEVDLSAQHMWFIQDGAVVMECDVVTGEPTPAKATIPGVWTVKGLQRNATLVGAPLPGETEPEYRTKVAFWMPITWSGIGFHDATWQPAFGGNLYASGYGSHGCINMPYDSASQLFNLLSVGMPAIVHY